MDENFLNDYFNDLNSELGNRQFTSELKREFGRIDKSKLKELIEKHF